MDSWATKIAEDLAGYALPLPQNIGIALQPLGHELEEAFSETIHPALFLQLRLVKLRENTT